MKRKSRINNLYQSVLENIGVEWVDEDMIAILRVDKKCSNEDGSLTRKSTDKETQIDEITTL